MFKDVIDLNRLVILHNFSCPCKYAPDIAISRLEEYIEELKQEVNR